MVKLVNTLLQQETQEFDFQNPAFDAKDFAESLMKCMIDNNGIGLAANQCGVGYSIIALRTDPILVMFNPKIVHLSEKTTTLDEGCLSYPGLLVKIKRPETVRVRYQLFNGTTETKLFSGITSHIVQHEIDHLNGILFFNKANRFHRDKALRKFKNEHCT